MIMDYLNYMGIFTAEEINLMCIYDTSSRATLRDDLVTAFQDVYDTEMIVLFGSVFVKLDLITDEDFAEIGFYAAEDNSAAFDF
jgi:hypothetical protein